MKKMNKFLLKKSRQLGLLIIAVTLLLSGCGVNVSLDTPQDAAKSLIRAYQYQEEDAVLKCYGLDKEKKIDKEIQNEINYNMKFYNAHQANDVSFKGDAILGSFEEYYLLYVFYDFKSRKEDDIIEAPAIAAYFVRKEDKKYYVVPSKDVTAEMGEISKAEYTKFIETDEYKEYEKRYQEFIKENPEYEDTVSEELKK